MEEKLIESVRTRKILYDSSSHGYMSTKLKNQVWEDVAKEIGLPNGNEAKGVWIKLRHSLRDALRRQDKYSKSALAETFKLWKYQKQMGFLQPYMSNRLREGYLIKNANEDENSNSTSNSALLRTNNDIKESEEQQIMDSEISKSNVKPEAHIEFVTPRPKKIPQNDLVVTLLKQIMARREERSKERTVERAKLLEQIKSTEIPSNDSLYHFFMSMYVMTKAMPPSAQHNVRNRVFNAVTEVEAALLNNIIHDDNEFSTDHKPDNLPSYDEYTDQVPGTS